MKKTALLPALFCGALLLAGCGGSKADENKTPEQIKQEVTSMSASDINATVESYKKEIAAKTAELKAETEKLSKIPLLEQLGDEAKGIKANMSKLSESIKKLENNMKAYLDGLKGK